MRVGLVAFGALTAAILLLHCSEFGADGAPVNEAGVPDAASDTSLAPSDGGADAMACSADLSKDPRHCGRCGHECLGGDCTAGRCDPFVLGGGLTNPREIAIGASGIYFEVGAEGSKRTVVRCPRSGCPATGPELVVGQLDDVRSLLVVGSTLLFSTHDNASTVSVIEVCDVDQCAATRRTVDGPVSVVIPAFTPVRRGADGAYWGKLAATSGEIRRLPLPLTEGGTPATVVSSTDCSPGRVAVSPGDVAWTCSFRNEVRRCALPCTVDGGTLVETPGAALGHFERTATHLLWETDDRAFTIRTLATTEIRTLPARGVGPFVVVEGEAIFQDSLMERIALCALPACASVATLASQTVAASIAADDVAVFWTVPSDGTVRAVAR